MPQHSSAAIPSDISALIDKASWFHLDDAYEEALAEFGKAVELIQQQRQIDRPLQSSKARCHLNMGDIFIKRQDWESAETEFSRAAGIFETLGIMTGLAESLNGLATVSACKEEFDFAIDRFRQAINIFAESKEAQRAASSYAGMAMAMYKMGDTGSARSCIMEVIEFCDFKLPLKNQTFEKAISVAKKLGDQSLQIKLLEKQIDNQRKEARLARKEYSELAEQKDEQQSQVETKANSSDSPKQENPTTVNTTDAAEAKIAAIIEEKNEELRHFIRKAAHDMKEPQNDIQLWNITGKAIR